MIDILRTQIDEKGVVDVIEFAQALGMPYDWLQMEITNHSLPILQADTTFVYGIKHVAKVTDLIVSELSKSNEPLQLSQLRDSLLISKALWPRKNPSLNTRLDIIKNVAHKALDGKFDGDSFIPNSFLAQMASDNASNNKKLEMQIDLGRIGRLYCDFYIKSSSLNFVD
jgi:hypothetical protein